MLSRSGLIVSARQESESLVYTIGRLAKRFGLSRSTLLYYDSIGLLRPSARSSGKYRLYSESDARRLDQICVYRRAGLPLKQIDRLLDSPEDSIVPILENRLEELNHDIERRRRQQRFILGILKSDDVMARIGVMNMRTWVSLLTASGFTQEDMIAWHREFERLSPEKHLKFLEFLCIPEKDIATIRSWASK